LKPVLFVLFILKVAEADEEETELTTTVNNWKTFRGHCENEMIFAVLQHPKKLFIVRPLKIELTFFAYLVSNLLGLSLFEPKFNRSVFQLKVRKLNF